MSWITDHKDNPGTEQETICRVYGHRLSAAATSALSSNSHTTSSLGMWMTIDELEAAASADNGEETQAQQLILGWLRMWVFQQDESGNPVRRGFGVATGDAGAFINWVGATELPFLLSASLLSKIVCRFCIASQCVFTLFRCFGHCVVWQNNQGPNGNPDGHISFDLSDGTKPVPPPALFSPGPIPPSEYARVLPVEDAAQLEKIVG